VGKEVKRKKVALREIRVFHRTRESWAGPKEASTDEECLHDPGPEDLECKEK